MANVVNWRQMMPADLPALLAVQQEAYPWHQEAESVFVERMSLYPPGCLTLDGDVGLIGYILSHPWHAESPPPLDAALGELPERPGTYYLHDLALLKTAYGLGHGARVVRHLAEAAGASGFSTMSLVAVNQSEPFWRRQGFETVSSPQLAAKTASYGDDAVFMTRALCKKRR